jgi:hypothetical protein
LIVIRRHVSYVLSGLGTAERVIGGRFNRVSPTLLARQPTPLSGKSEDHPISVHPAARIASWGILKVQNKSQGLDRRSECHDLLGLLDEFELDAL